MPRDTRAAAARIIYMDNAEIELFAKRDPDIFRDVAAALIAVTDAPDVCEDNANPVPPTAAIGSDHV